MKSEITAKLRTISCEARFRCLNTEIISSYDCSLTLLVYSDTVCLLTLFQVTNLVSF